MKRSHVDAALTEVACADPTAMGPAQHPAAVVDHQCRVHGIDGLWVIDGSVLPTVTSRGPHASIVMLGHRAAEFVS